LNYITPLPLLTKVGSAAPSLRTSTSYKAA